MIKATTVKSELDRRERRETRRNVSLDERRKRAQIEVSEVRVRDREGVLRHRRNTAGLIAKDRKLPVEDPEIYFLVQDLSLLSCGLKTSQPRWGPLNFLKRRATDIDITRYYYTPDIKRSKMTACDSQINVTNKQAVDRQPAKTPGQKDRPNLKHYSACVEKSEMHEQLKFLRAKMAVVKGELERRERRENRRKASVDELRKRAKTKVNEARVQDRERILEYRRNSRNLTSAERSAAYLREPDLPPKRSTIKVDPLAHYGTPEGQQSKMAGCGSEVIASSGFLDLPIFV